MHISELFDLHGRTALIIGGSGVLGRVMASGLAQAGARVAALGRREEPVLADAASIRATGGEAIGVAADVLDHSALERASTTITTTLGPVDILIGEPADLLDTLLWLVSPASAFVTGVVIPVDGGFASFSGV